MGMYDEYHGPAECPVCHHIQDYWQGKDGPCTERQVKLGDVVFDCDWQPVTEGTLELHEVCGSSWKGDHWLDALAIVYEGRWVATLIVKVSSMDGDADLWDIARSDT